MSFPEFLSTLPVFVRTLATRHRSEALIALDDARVSYADAESHSARLAGGRLARGAGKGTRELDKRRFEALLAKRIDG